MSTLERLNEQLAQLEAWPETLARLEEIEYEPYWAWEQTQLLIREIEQDADLEAWAQRLTEQERDATDLPPSYAYTHLVLLPFLRTYFDKITDEELNLEEERLEDEHPSAILSLATILTITMAPTLLALSQYINNEDDDAQEEREDQHLDDEHDLTLSVEGFYTRFNRLVALPALPLKQLDLQIDFREDLAQRLDLERLVLPELDTLSLNLNQANNTHLAELLAWSTHQPKLKTLALNLCTSYDSLGLTQVPRPDRVNIFYESDVEQRGLYELLASGILHNAQELHLFEQSLEHQDERPPSPKQDELLPVLASNLPATLKELTLGYAQDTTLDLSALTHLSGPTELKRLTISRASFTPGSLKALLESPLVRSLESLTLFTNRLRDEDAELLALTAPETLTYLALDRNLLTQAGAVALATSPRLQALEYFSMYGELLYVESAQHLYEQFRDQANRSQEERFGELRSLLQQPPSKERWEELCAILDLWPDMEQLEQEVIPYALSYTEAWPIELCVMPERWLWRAKEGLPAPMLQLVTTVVSTWIDGPEVVSRSYIVGNHPQLRRLRSLVLDYTIMDQETLSALAFSPNLQQLQALSLADYEWENPQAPQLVFLSAQWPSLTQLSIDGVGTEELIARLLQAPYIAQLSSLAIAQTPLEREQLKALMKTGMFKQLEQLTLQQCELNDEGLKLLYNTSAPRLWHLDLNVNDISSKGLTALLQSSLGKQLRVLELGYNPLIEGNAFTTLTDAQLQLERLNLSATGIPEHTLETLAQCAWLQNLKVLDLSSNEFSESKGLAALIQSPHLGSLEQLILHSNNLSKEQYELIHHTMTLPQAVRDQFHPDQWDEDNYMEDIFE